MKSNQLIVASACSLLMAWGCASQPKNNPDATYSEIKQSELSQERRTFINDTEGKLQQVDKDIGLTQAKIEHESQYVSAEQRAEWTQEAFELKQERQRLTGELKRAEKANDAEWKEMRGPIGVATDSLQAAATKFGNGIAKAFDNKQYLGANEGLCPLRVAKPGAKVEAKVAEQSKTVVVDVTVKDPAAVDELRKKAAELARNTTAYGPVNEDTSKIESAPPSAQKTIPVALATRNIDDGVRVTFTPNAKELQALEERLNYDAKMLKEDRCSPPNNAQASLDQRPAN